MKKRKGLLVILLLLVLSLVFVACNNTETPLTEGAETGMYICTTVTDSQQSISLYGGNRFTLTMDDKIKSGEYSLDGKKLTLDFQKVVEVKKTHKLVDDGSQSASYDDEVISMDYNGVTFHFLKQVMRTVEFVPGNGDNLKALSVPNGMTAKTSDMPDIDYPGFTLIGWCTDAEFKNDFIFGKTPVTENIKLYAYWVKSSSNRNEFTVSFDWNFDGAPKNPNSTKTNDGKIYAFPQTISNSLIFKGWWVGVDNDRNKLAYPVELSRTVFEENTTLFALWQQPPSGSNIAAPVLVIEQNQIKWESVPNVVSYSIEIKDPSGTSVINTTLPPVSVSYTYEFKEAGEYTIILTAIGTVSTNRASATRYYKNRALPRVSNFEILNSSVLQFNQVKNAENYKITIICGNDLHNHSNINLYKSTIYNFSACEMSADGIKFIVTASADGFMPSTGEYVYNNRLDAISEISIDAEVMSWHAIIGATNYDITIKQNEVSNTVDNLDSTSYSLKHLDVGEYKIKVVPRANGYNPPKEEIWHDYKKTSIAAPSSICIEGTEIKWATVDAAESYTISIGGLEIEAAKTDTSYQLSAADLLTLNQFYDKAFDLMIRSNGDNPSAYSAPIKVRNFMPEEVVYDKGVLSWDYVLGAYSYEVNINPGTEFEEHIDTVVINSCPITLNKAGLNTIQVIALDKNDSPLGNGTGTATTFAYTVSVMPTGGQIAVDKFYFAENDPMDLLYNATITRTGYTFEDFYTSPGGGQQNAKRFVCNNFITSNLTLYAGWLPLSYMINLDADIGTITSQEYTAVYDAIPTIEIPSVNGNGFIGWYTAPNGGGTRLTNELGIGNSSWDTIWETIIEYGQDVTLYAYYANVFSFTATLDNSAYSVSLGTNASLVKSVIIPDEYNGKPVISISTLTGTSIENITIGKNIKEFEDESFRNVRNLKNYYVHPENTMFKDIAGVLYNKSGNELLRYPVARERVTISQNTQTIGNRAFAYFSGLKGIAIPGNVKTISSDAFRGCNNLKTIQLTEGLDRIEEYAFSDCIALEEISLPKNLTFLGKQAFENCSLLKKVIFAGDSTKELIIDEEVFANNYNLAEVIFEKGSQVQSISEKAFYNNNMIEEIRIPASVKEIGALAFYNCTGLKTIIIEDESQLAEIGTNVFFGTSILEEVKFEGSAQMEIFYKDIFNGHSSLKSITLPTGLSTVEDLAFENCTSLEKIIILGGSQFATIGQNTFKGCVSLTEITLPANTQNLNASMFADCINLETVLTTTESSPKYLSVDDALYTANGATLVYYPAKKSGSFNIPQQMSAIAEGALQYSVSIESFILPAANTNFVVDDGVLFNKQNTAIIKYPSLKIDTSYTIPDNITIISKYAFKAAIKLEEILFDSELLTDIGDYAFDGCIELSAMTLPSTIEHIGKYIFRGCHKLETLTVESGVVNIGEENFAGISGLKNVIIAETVISIGKNAFKDCINLEQVVFSGESQLETIGEGSFENCQNLESIILPAHVTTIEANAFKGCNLISNASNLFVLPDELITIGEGAFRQNGANFVSVVIPASVETLGDYAFYNTVGIKYITFKGNATTTLTMGDYVFAENTALAEVEFEDGCNVINIGNFAFYGCITTTKTQFEFVTIDIPKSVTTIGDYAFANNVISKFVVGVGSQYFGLKVVNFAQDGNLITIGEMAFSNTALEEVILPDSVEELKQGAFMNNGGTQSNFATTKNIVINPTSNLKIIGDDAFNKQNNNSAIWEDLVLPEGLEIIGARAFYQCSYIPGDLIIPSTVVRIGESAFNMAFKQGGNLVIPQDSQLEVIGDNAFAGGNSWTLKFSGTDLKLPNTLISLGDGAFSGIDYTGTLYYPASLSHIGENPFKDSKFQSIAFEGEITEIKASLFQGNKFKNITIPASVTKIGAYAFAPTYANFGERAGAERLVFEEGSPLTSADIGVDAFCSYGERSPQTIVNLPSNISTKDIYSIFGKRVENYEVTDTSSSYAYTEIDGVLFDKLGTTLMLFPAGRGTNVAHGEEELVNYEIPAGTIAIYPYAFANSGATDDVNYSGVNYGLYSVILPDSLQTIGESAFANGIALKTVTANLATSTLKSLGINAFSKCIALSSFDFPNSLNSLGVGAFAGCTSLVMINIEDDRLDYRVVGDFFMDLQNDKIVAMLSDSETVTIPYSITEIGASLFANRTKIKTLRLHANITSIGDNAFNGCTSLSSIIFIGTEEDENAPSQLVSIGDYAFYKCNLEKADIPKNVTTIGMYAFSENYDMGAIKFEEGSVLETIGDFAFSGLYNKNITSLSFPNTLRSIGKNAFSGSGITCELRFPASLQNINDGAFYGQMIPKITFEDNSNLKIIGQDAFRDCTKLTSIDLGLNSSLSSIGSSAFENCYELKTFYIPDLLEADGIGQDAFIKSGLESFTVSESNLNFTVLDGVLYNKAITKIVCYPSFNKNLDEGDVFVLPSTVTTIGAFAFAIGVINYWDFETNKSVAIRPPVKKILLHNNVTTIQQKAFGYANVEVNIPFSVQTIDEKAFWQANQTVIKVQGRTSDNVPSGWHEEWCDNMNSVLWNQ